ncbi:MAG TPA: SDR family NAD(P)-dependent oxidoreductase [Acidobacteriaceae bacterium]|jgi:3-oxoacyl-[acyl-carrier protein] reductase|nr:SDR family NAD(P)-dependent oxidoreductase [Acidobacteriaceae bacterium]
MRNVLVTGASRGLGLGIVSRLMASGYCVLALARSETKDLAALRAQAESAGCGKLSFRAFDLSHIDEIPALVTEMRKQAGPLYGLVNCAGISFEGSLAMMPTSQIEQMVQVNLLSPMVLTKAVVRGMMSDGAGRIVSIASITAFTGYSGLAVYAATKSALTGFSRSLAREVGRMGVNVNCVAPGFIDTQMTSGLAGEQRERVIRRSALRRLADVSDVAGAVEFLLSDGAKNITGTVVTVDAGSTA